jgi:hypothetical protein
MGNPYGVAHQDKPVVGCKVVNFVADAETLVDRRRTH